MNTFEEQIVKFDAESDELQKKQIAVQEETRLFNEKFGSFLKENGLPDTFPLVKLAALSIRKAK